MFQTLSRATVRPCIIIAIMMSAAHACASADHLDEGAALPANNLVARPDQVRSGGVEVTACCSPATLEDLVAMAAKRRGLVVTKDENGEVRYGTAPGAVSTILLGYVLEASPETGRPTEASLGCFAEFRARIDAYMRGVDGAPGAAERHGGFITAIHPIAPVPRLTQSRPFLPAPLPEAARREENLRLFRLATGAEGAPPLPPGGVIVLFNDLKWGRMPAAMSVEQAISFLESGFASGAHRLTRRQTDKELSKGVLPHDSTNRSQP